MLSSVDGFFISAHAVLLRTTVRVFLFSRGDIAGGGVYGRNFHVFLRGASIIAVLEARS